MYMMFSITLNLGFGYVRVLPILIRMHPHQLLVSVLQPGVRHQKLVGSAAFLCEQVG